LATAFSDDGLTEAECNEVYEILEMHRALHFGQRELPADAGISAKDVRFRGFDGNNETKHMAYVRFIRSEDKYDELGDQNGFNSHAPMLDRCRRMLPVADEANAAAWSDAIRNVVGDLRTQLNVAGVLNLSGTLFRTSPKERISTVRYADVKGERGEDRIQSIADYEIHPERLVREGLLQAPDLYLVGATVEIVNLTTAEVTTGAIADLDDDSAKRLALRQLNLKPEWIQQLLTVTLDQLESRHRDAKRSPVKALIVTYRQDMARLFAQEVDRQMVSRQIAEAHGGTLALENRTDARGRRAVLRLPV
jgi:hypothetical protein